MKKSIKLFLKLFFLLLVLEISIGIANAMFFQNNTMLFGIDISSITNFIMMLFSLPMSLLGRDLPFYAREAWLGIVLTILNIAIQSFIIMQLYKTLKRSKTKNPKD